MAFQMPIALPPRALQEVKSDVQPVLQDRRLRLGAAASMSDPVLPCFRASRI